MKRERITITIDPEMLPALDHLVDGDQIRNRSQAIEQTLKSGLKLSELTAVFFILGMKKEVNPALVDFLSAFPLEHLYLVASSDTNIFGLEASLTQLVPFSETHVVPADFGDAAAILLSAKKLSPSFLIIDLDQLMLPSVSPLATYAFHRQQGARLTQLITPTGDSFASSGISFAQREIVEAIPAGLASLKQDIFPILLKAGTVRTYVC